ncbi:putative ATP-grasp-modified RiPP [Streptomyces sp. NPDC087658]
MSTTTAPWGMRRMTPLRNGGPVAPYVGIDPGTQTGRWIGDDVLDWRAEYRALAYEPVDCPDDLRTALARFLRHFGLRFGAFDFAVTPDGAW